MRNVRWITNNTWACLKHAPSLRLPSSQAKCWLCSDARPEAMEVVLDLPVKVEKAKDLIIKDLNILSCDWVGCINPPRYNSKYCSRGCSNKNARKRYSERKKLGA